MPGGNSTSRPYNRKEKQADLRMKEREKLANKMLEQAREGNIDPDIAKLKIDAMYTSKGANKDSDIWVDNRMKEVERIAGKKYMKDRSTPKGTRGARAPSNYYKGGYCGASNPAARPMKKGK